MLLQMGNKPMCMAFKSSIFSFSFKPWVLRYLRRKFQLYYTAHTSSLFSSYVQSGAMFSVSLFSVKYKLFEKNSQQTTAVYKTAVFTIIV